MAPGPQTDLQMPQAPVLSWTQLASSITGTRGTAWGYRILTGWRRFSPSLNRLYNGLYSLLVTWSIARNDTGQTETQAPQTWQASRLASMPSATIFSAPIRITFLQVIAQRPQRMQSCLPLTGISFFRASERATMAAPRLFSSSGASLTATAENFSGQAV